MGVNYNYYTGLVLEIKDSDVIEKEEILICSNKKCTNHSKNNNKHFEKSDKFCSKCGSNIISDIKEVRTNFCSNTYNDYEYEDVFYTPEYFPKILIPNESDDYLLLNCSIYSKENICEVTPEDIIELFNKINKDDTIMSFIDDFRKDFPDNEIKIKFVSFMYTS